VIAEHLYREGRFELADEFVSEAALPGAAELRAPYIALHTVLQQVRHGRASMQCWHIYCISHTTWRISFVLCTVAQQLKADLSMLSRYCESAA
jgi:hypothetical protein